MVAMSTGRYHWAMYSLPRWRQRVSSQAARAGDWWRQRMFSPATLPGRQHTNGRDGDGPGAAGLGAASHELAGQYAEALREYTLEGQEATLAWAFQLGHRAIDQGLGLRQMAAMHEAALVEALLVATAVADNTTRIVHLASEFLAVALAPFEKRHRRAEEEHSTLSNLNLGLEQWLNATQHKLEAAQSQLREARKGDLRKNGAILAMNREIHGSLSMLKGLVADDLNPHARRLLNESIENSERVTRLVTDSMEAPTIEAGDTRLDAVPQGAGSASGSSS
jgi:hypothetical protein